MIKKTTVQSCCGSATLLFTTDRPIRRHQVKAFESAGWTVPESHLQAGLFYAYKGGVYCSAALGSNTFKVSMRGGLDTSELEGLLDSATNI